ncbi:MAG: MarR family transcriptional regulator [Ilumatobacteraceae bacterium]
MAASSGATAPSSSERPAGADAGPTDDEIGRLRLVLLRLARQIRSNSPGDVTPSQLSVVATLARHGPCTIGQIAEHERVRVPSASKIAESVVGKGLAERRVDPDDRRRVVLALSADGETLLADLRRAGIEWLAPRLDRLTADDRALIREVVPVLERLLVVDGPG